MNFPTSCSSDMELYRYLSSFGMATTTTNNNISNNDIISVNDTNMYSHNNNNSHNNNYSCGSSLYPDTTGLMNESTTMMTMTESKAITASRILHKEAEKRRRERINSHLDRLRCLLPCTSKTDKATLLSKVVQRVLELKRQTSELLELENILIPSENDEFHVYIHGNNTQNDEHDDNDDEVDNEHDYSDGDDNNGNNNNSRVIMRASLCCEDRPDLFSDLNQVLTSLNLKTIRAEISTLGGRIQGVFVVSTDNNDNKSCQRDDCAMFLRDALKGIVQRSSGSDDRLKRRRRVFDPTNC